MYKIIGSDGVEYGPIPAEQVRLWISQRRLNGQSRIKPADAADWTTLGQLAEFADALAKPVSAPPPPIAPVQPALTAGGSQRRYMGLAVTSLVLGILGMFSCGVTALAGLICGIIALVKMGKPESSRDGKGLALAGTIVSGLFILLIPVMAALMLPALAKAKAKATVIRTISNAKQLALGVRIYSTDNNGQFPPAETWSDAVLKSVTSERVFQAPTKPSLRCGFAYNARVAGLIADKVAPDTVLFFESDQGWNASGGPEIMIKVPRQNSVFVVAFADGSVKQLRFDELANLRWNP